MRQALYQVWVLDRTNRQLPVGPRVLKPAAEKFANAIAMQIRAGREKDWHDPIVLEAI